MNILTQIFMLIGRLLRWWVIVEPWEQAVRVRLGKNVKLMLPGLHFRIPFADAIYLQNVRMRAMNTYTQTITTPDDYLITVSGMLRFRIEDVLKLQQTVHDAKPTLLNMAQSLIAQCLATHNHTELTPKFVSEWVSSRLNFSQFGLGEVNFAVQDFAAPRRVIRLIQDSLGQQPYGNTFSTNVSREKASNTPAVASE